MPLLFLVALGLDLNRGMTDLEVRRDARLDGAKDIVVGRSGRQDRRPAERRIRRSCGWVSSRAESRRQAGTRHLDQDV